MTAGTRVIAQDKALQLAGVAFVAGLVSGWLLHRLARRRFDGGRRVLHPGCIPAS